MITIWLIFSIFTFILLITNKDIIGVEFLKSYIFNDEFDKRNYELICLLYSIIFPITLFKLFKIIKLPIMKDASSFFKKFLPFIIIIGIIYFSVPLVKSGVNYYNTSVNLELQFNQTLNKRLVVIDRITKIVHQKMQIAKINDSSYYKNVLAIMMMRKDGDNLSSTWKWIHENNPNVNYEEVSKFYANVSASIDAERNTLFVTEDKLQTLCYDYAKLHKEFPSKLYLWYQKDTLSYIPISTTVNKIINKTGIDNQIDL